MSERKYKQHLRDPAATNANELDRLVERAFSSRRRWASSLPGRSPAIPAVKPLQRPSRSISDRGSLRSNEVVVEFKDNRLKRATATGSPDEFEQKRSDSDVVVRGHADEIVYEGDPGTILLSNAYINDGKNDIQGPQIVYSLRKERVGATTSGGGS
jgi:LptA/(LptD N-terminal domain) LPS transport protein